MDFNVGRLAADAGSLFSRAVQYTEEILGQAERTELDAHLENLLNKAEATRQWTEKIMKQTEVVLQPNPNIRLEEFLYKALEKMPTVRPNNLELLGQCMVDAGHEFGPGTPYGTALIRCGEAEKQLGLAERESVQSASINFITPLNDFIEGDSKTIIRESKVLQSKRLDLDAAKSRLKRAKEADARSASLNSTPPLGEEYVAHFSYMLSFLHVKWMKMWTEEVSQAETEVLLSQTEFDRQAEITRLLLEGLSNTHTHHLRCLTDFVDTQTNYYAQCHHSMVNLKKQMGRFSSVFQCANNNQSFVDIPTLDAISLPSITLEQEPNDKTLSTLTPTCLPSATTAHETNVTSRPTTSQSSLPYTFSAPVANGKTPQVTSSQGPLPPATTTGPEASVKPPATTTGPETNVTPNTTTTGPEASVKSPAMITGSVNPSSDARQSLQLASQMAPEDSTKPVLNASNPAPSFKDQFAINGTRKARVVCNYNAVCSSELSLQTNEVIIVSCVPGMDPDWLWGEQGDKRGKVPVTCLQLLS